MREVPVDREVFKRVNTRITPAQDSYIKSEAKKSRGTISEGEIHRALLDEAIISRKNK